MDQPIEMSSGSVLRSSSFQLPRLEVGGTLGPTDFPPASSRQSLHLPLLEGMAIPDSDFLGYEPWLNHPEPSYMGEPEAESRDDVFHDLWGQFDVMPTPPVSPHRVPSPCQPSTSSACTAGPPNPGCSDEAQSWVQFEEQLLSASVVPPPFLSVMKSNPMISQSLTYDPRGLYTPAPSPSASSSEDEGDEDDFLTDPAPTLGMRAGHKRGVLQLPTTSTKDGDESEEEIDVVTVETTHPKLRRVLSPGCSFSAPVSPLPSPKPILGYAHSSGTGALSSLALKSSRKLRRTSSFTTTTTPEQVTNGNESDDDKKACHNNLERKRRNDLKASFVSLRVHIPELEDNERAPKVVILQKASELIKHLRTLHKSQGEILQKESSRNSELSRKLGKLKQQLRK
nr:myc proto-oncogene protein-like [Halisarca dujardinii]